MRVVFDTNTAISALLFGRSLAWLVDHWRSRVAVPLVSRATADEFLRTLHYPKFGLPLRISRLTSRATWLSPSESRSMKPHWRFPSAATPRTDPFSHSLSPGAPMFWLPAMVICYP